jgi:hypothetical protein
MMCRNREKYLMKHHSPQRQELTNSFLNSISPIGDVELSS